MAIDITRRMFSTGAVLGAMAASKTMAQTGTLMGSAAAQGASDILSGLREEFPIPAISGAVVRNGETIWSDTQGFADLELGVAASPDHLFRLGSVSKVVTAAIGARLVDGGIVELDAPIATYRPDLPEVHRATTLRQLYSHQGGVRHYGLNDLSPMSEGGSIDTKVYRNTDDALALFIDDPLVAEVGTSVNYSTFGYTLISAVLESASGTEFTRLIAEQVAGPLALTRLHHDDMLALIPGRVGLYDPPVIYQRFMPMPDVDVVNSFSANPAYKWAGGGMVGSASDVARFGAAQMSGDFLSDAMRETLFTPRAQMSPEIGLGLGWRIDGHETLGSRYHHAGNMQGCRAQLALYPEHGLSVALISNLGATPGPILGYTDRIAQAFTG